jgi:FkbM family methyltransferase
MILRRLFEKQKKGFYVDVGAHHPFRFSNTYFFYKKGWRGINIDATPGCMRLFNKFRPRDLNLEYAISDSKRVLPYYIFEVAALNTFSKELADNRIEDGRILLREEKIRLYPLSKILDDHLGRDAKIDFMSVDAEGFDFSVIKSNDWDKYRPTVILVESLDFDLANYGESEMYNYLSGTGYKLFAKTINTLFFKSII